MSNPHSPVDEIPRKVCSKCQMVFVTSADVCPDDNTQLVLMEEDPLIGTIFAEKYEIRSILGRGGMSVVYKARHKYMDRIVAVKLLLEHLVGDNVAAARFEQESKAAASLSHQNIVSVHDFGISSTGQAYFVMDCLEGDSLEDIIFRDGRVELNRAVDVFRQVCEGLQHAHKKGIIHRDLKPSNIVLIKEEDGSETAKIVDFGIAKVHNGQEKDKPQQVRLTQTGEVFGSPLYMSPEQCQGYNLDARSDIYSLGCLMYETLSGTTPFAADSFLNMALLHVHKNPPSFSQTASAANIPKPIEEVVMKCLAKDPNDRYDSAEQVRQKLLDAALLSGLPGLKAGAVPLPKVESGPQSPLRRTWESMKAVLDTDVGRKTKKSFSLAQKIGTALGMLLLVAAGAIFFFFPGAQNDGGTPYQKQLWGTYMFLGQHARSSHDYSAAKRYFDDAAKLARSFKDRSDRLLKTVREQAQLYHAMNDSVFEEQANKEIGKILTAQIIQEADECLAGLAANTPTSNSSAQQTINQTHAIAFAYNILRSAKRLYSRGLYQKDEQLLNKAIEQFDQLDLDRKPEMSAFKIAQADCYLAQQQMTKVRKPLLDAVEILYRPNLLDKPKTDLSPAQLIDLKNYVLALTKLAAFDRDQSDFASSRKEYEKALATAEKYLESDGSLMNLVLNSYADMVKQTVGPGPEYQALLARAHKYPPGDITFSTLLTDQ